MASNGLAQSFIDDIEKGNLVAQAADTDMGTDFRRELARDSRRIRASLDAAAAGLWTSSGHYAHP